MTDKSKKRVRDLQKRTGYSYSECLRMIRTMTPEAREALIQLRATPIQPNDDTTRCVKCNTTCPACPDCGCQTSCPYCGPQSNLCTCEKT